MDLEHHSLDQFVSNDLNKKVPQHLYHYCKEKSVSSILNEGVFCTNSKCLSDKTECSLGWQYAKTILASCNSKNYENHLVNQIEKCREDNTSIRFWSFSLCENGNSPKMKEMYGPPLLKFDYKCVHNEITQLMGKDLNEPLQTLHFFLPCFYLNPNDSTTYDGIRIQTLIQFIFDEYLNELLRHLYDNNEEKRIDIATACSFMLDTIIKDAHFAGEQEWRIIVITFDDSPKCRCMGGKCRLHAGISYTPTQHS